MVIVYGVVVSSAPRFAPLSLNWTPITPMLSEAVAEATLDAPLNTAFGVGAVSAMVGATLSVGTAPLALPDESHVTFPLNALNAIPRRLLPSSPTWAAGTSKRTHLPAAGNAPIERRLFEPVVPYWILSAPQNARCSQVPSFHCSMISVGGFAGSR